MAPSASALSAAMSVAPTVPLKERWFEDYAVGEVFEFGDRLVIETEIVEFALRYDPQPFHTDAEAAALVASGWMTGALLMREMCEHFISPLSAMGSPGVDELRWLRPVRPGDRLRVRVTVIEVRRSQSKPDRGAVTLRQEVINQAGDVVMTMRGRSLQRCRTRL
jgi:acyl dehydratase